MAVRGARQVGDGGQPDLDGLLTTGTACRDPVAQVARRIEEMGPEIEARPSGSAHPNGQPGGVSFELRISPDPDIRLEGPPHSLAAVPGVLWLYPNRERAQRVGYITRSAGLGYYNVSLFLFDSEMAHVLALLAAGLRPHRMRLESDSEWQQWADSDEYWDDVRYPLVELTDFSLKWAPGRPAALPEPAAAEADAEAAAATPIP